MVTALSRSQARRIALAAQGFADPPPSGRVDARHLRRVIDRVRILQIDSVSAVVRSHYLPPFSRLGTYDRTRLDDLIWGRREMAEQWFHVASFVGREDVPLARWRAARREVHPRAAEVLDANPGILDKVRAELAEHGPMAIGESAHHDGATSAWWGWSAAKLAVEHLFMHGEVGVADRAGFTRRYDLIERVLPPEVLTDQLDDAEALRRHVRLAARAQGVATLADIADYVRLTQRQLRPVVAELADAGELESVTVEGWSQPAWRHVEARLPRRIDRATLLSPFDSLVWFRDRDERLWDFRYRIEIYTPETKRRFGYYVLPLLVGEHVVGRLDVRRVGAESLLRIPAAWHEPGVEPEVIAEPAARSVRDLATWLGCEQIAIDDRGDLAPTLARAMTSTVSG